MEGSYGVALGGERLGRIQVTRQGLYFCFDCRCDLFSEQMYDVIVAWEDKEERLGLLAPREKRLILTAKLPVKKAGQGEPRFFLRPRHCPMSEAFVPLRPEEPFAFLQRLEGAYLEKRAGQCGIVLNAKKCKIRA